MKINELVTNDLVRNKETKWIYRVTGTNLTEDGRVEILLDYYVCCDKSVIEPIPLTEEILHTNGALQAYEQFTIALDDKHILFLFYKPDCYMVCIDEREGNTAFDLVRRLYIKYVHELQHILRVAGYKEFADNIKLE